MKLFPLIVSLMALTAATASAQQTRSSVTVSYGDLNLRSEGGQKILDARLASAVRTVCGVYEGSVVPEYRDAHQRCLTEKRAEVAGLRAHALASVPQALASR